MPVASVKKPQVGPQKSQLEPKKKQVVATPQKLSKPPTIKLPQNIFNATINAQAIFDSIMSERASQRQGTHKVKTRAEVSGTGKKPFAQKGTGNARQGSKRSPQ